MKQSGEISDDIFGPATHGPFFPHCNLVVFNVQYNGITGNVPTRQVRCSKMNAFLLNENQMTGVVNASLNDFLAGRKYCDLSGNKWTCPLPSSASGHCKAACQN